VYDPGTIIFFGVMWLLFGFLQLYRAYRGEKLEQQLITLATPEPQRMARRQRLSTLWLGIANLALGVVWFARAFWR
jgi:hypothetical protein